MENRIRNLLGKTTLVGTFIKTPSLHIVEILGATNLNFAVIDAEHAPFDRHTIDQLIVASRAVGLPLLVRVPDSEPSTILSALDLGAAGILVPHVDTPEHARAVVSRARFRGGSRGYSGSPRFASYGATNMAAAIEAGDTAVILCQIESAEGLANAHAIAGVPGVDGLFIGPADLSLSMGVAPASEALFAAMTQIIEAAQGAGKLAAMFAKNAEEVDAFRRKGVSIFVVASDQSLLRDGASRIAAAVEQLQSQEQ
ncbi:HpcH/HpaI aldolase family protein [Paraburkholderia sp. J12]|uniref:HpcH/HpaI aldolase family protein n=1 Tax=Paraburkholderia sp. J12 TaxID=2805432 RepID=UPI002ABE6C8B|nr:aldolase/citrate lyase family protein [Paraburkholderia sp. J12]